MKKTMDSNNGTFIYLSILVFLIILAVASVFLHRSYEKRSADGQETIAPTAEAVFGEPEKTDSTEAETEVDIDFIHGFMETAPAGTIVNGIEPGTLEYYFVSYEISDEVFARINGKSYVENPNVGLEDLRYLKVLHYNFAHQPQVGELIVSAELAEDYLSIFQILFDMEYEIEKMHLIDDYWGEGVDNPDDADTASCEDNNTSCFCYRAQTNATKLSNHAYGRAIDINPQMNPYVSYTTGEAVWYHENSNDYIDRSVFKVHMIMEDDACCQLFASFGFEWGGSWKSIKDYQHFEK